MNQLLEVMKRLRTPETGCPWDLEQTFESIAPYTIEEAYEVTDAIERNDLADLKSELGDLLFQVVFHSQIATEQDQFAFDDVAQAITNKMIERHPHVFGDSDMRDSDQQTIAWEQQKAEERKRQAKSGEDVSALDGVAGTLPAMIRSQKLQKRAARVGFDWPSATDVLEKCDEELAELKEAILADDTNHIEEELGDLMFVMVNLCRKLDADAEQVLKNANTKFIGRFKAMEQLAREKGQSFAELSLQDQESLWQDVKRNQKRTK
ncbi:MAG: nucleoside triphosphate pyrophosphohydrolase [Ponticaulis sp.]|nr:nucleoside triphosphate pyrophosphohydrolase [Ponticaulis sp.]